jgi:hypothetical protein
MATKVKTKLQVKEAQKIIYGLIMKGYSNYKMIDYLVTNNIYNTESAAAKSIDTFNKKLYKIADKDLANLKQKYIEQYEDIYLKCIEAKDRKNAITALNAITKLQGLDINKIEAKVENVYKIEF